MTDRSEAIAWAEKVAKSKPPRYTDASRNAAQVILADAEALKAADELERVANAVWLRMGQTETAVQLMQALDYYRKAREV